MGTVPWQESVLNGPMRHRDLLEKGTVSLPHLPAHALILKNMIRLLAGIILTGLLVS